MYFMMNKSMLSICVNICLIMSAHWAKLGGHLDIQIPIDIYLSLEYKDMNTICCPLSPTPSQLCCKSNSHPLGVFPHFFQHIPS